MHLLAALAAVALLLVVRPLLLPPLLPPLPLPPPLLSRTTMATRLCSSADAATGKNRFTTWCSAEKATCSARNACRVWQKKRT